MEHSPTLTTAIILQQLVYTQALNQLANDHALPTSLLTPAYTHLNFTPTNPQIDHLHTNQNHMTQLVAILYENGHHDAAELLTQTIKTFQPVLDLTQTPLFHA